jgi:hypothetical protein
MALSSRRHTAIRLRESDPSPKARGFTMRKPFALIALLRITLIAGEG